MEVEIVFQNEDYLVVNKPFDLVINSNDDSKEDTLHKYLLNNLPNREKEVLHFVHRLDYATSGIICLARNKSAAATIGRLFQSRSVDKYYVALLRGNVQEEFVDITHPIGYDVRYFNGNKRMCTAEEGSNCLEPRKASTKLMVLQRGLFRGEPVTKVLLKPLTGRRHQLRVHCHSIGFTILGDYTYSEGRDSETLRMYLHAVRLKVPLKGSPMDVIIRDPFVEGSEECGGEWKVLEYLNDFDANDRNFYII